MKMGLIDIVVTICAIIPLLQRVSSGICWPQDRLLAYVDPINGGSEKQSQPVNK